MRLARIDPPGTWCLNEALFEILRPLGRAHFLEVGCGAGDLSQRLLERGFTGVGLDFSSDALSQASERLKHHVEAGRYRLVRSDLLGRPPLGRTFDLAMALFVIEHVEQDVAFLEILRSYVRPGGYVVLGVPGRKDLWSIEDETVGHLRRYERADLQKVMEAAGLVEPEIRSIAVPLANWLFAASNLAIRLSGDRGQGAASPRQQTEQSGIREIPFKTLFPPSFRVILNRVTLSPFFAVQRLFYRTGLGVTLLAKARSPA
jgi:SAM-dependent methyltransferase